MSLEHLLNLISGTAGCENMDIVINFIFLVLVFVEYISFFNTLLKREIRGFSRKQLIGCGISLVCMAGFGFGEWRRTLFYFAGILISIGMNCLLLEKPAVNVIKLHITAYPALSILEAIILYVIEMTADMGERGNAVVCLLCVIAILWFYYILLGKKLDKDAFYIDGHVWLIISVLMFLILGLISFFAYILTKLTGIREKTAGLIMITAGGLAIFIFIYVMIYCFNAKQKYQTERDFLEEYNDQQKQYFENLLKKEQDTRQFRHDITAHLLQIQNFCENREHEKEEQYIRGLLNEISLINKKGYCVGNDIIDTILNTYLTPISSICMIMVKGYVDREINIAGKDLCVIVSNLVKNAVEAVEQCTYEKKIVFEVNQGKQFLDIKVKNTAETENIIIRSKYPITRKENKRIHGLGIRNVKAVAETYQGSYQYRIEKGYYIAEVQLQI